MRRHQASLAYVIGSRRDKHEGLTFFGGCVSTVNEQRRVPDAALLAPAKAVSDKYSGLHDVTRCGGVSLRPAFPSREKERPRFNIRFRRHVNNTIFTHRSPTVASSRPLRVHPSVSSLGRGFRRVASGNKPTRVIYVSRRLNNGRLNRMRCGMPARMTFIVIPSTEVASRRHPVPVDRARGRSGPVRGPGGPLGPRHAGPRSTMRGHAGAIVAAAAAIYKDRGASRERS
jgi:hypothetical protein